MSNFMLNTFEKAVSQPSPTSSDIITRNPTTTPNEDNRLLPLDEGVQNAHYTHQSNKFWQVSITLEQSHDCTSVIHANPVLTMPLECILNPTMKTFFRMRTASVFKVLVYTRIAEVTTTLVLCSSEDANKACLKHCFQLLSFLE